MKKSFLVILAAGLAALTAWWFLHARPTPTPDQINSPDVQTVPPHASLPTAQGLAPTVSRPSPGGSNTSEATPPAAASLLRSPAVTSAFPASPTTSAEPPPLYPPDILLDNMRTTVRQYGLMFGGNPIGTNPEITKALNGDNPKQVKFLGPDGNRLNQKGELVDAWGTPYFFHQLSAMEMEIRSAGPDKIMYTTDDLVIK